MNFPSFPLELKAYMSVWWCDATFQSNALLVSGEGLKAFFMTHYLISYGICSLGGGDHMGSSSI